MGDGMWQLFLQSLQNITFAHRDGRQVRVRVRVRVSACPPSVLP